MHYGVSSQVGDFEMIYGLCSRHRSEAFISFLNSAGVSVSAMDGINDVINSKAAVFDQASCSANI